LTIAHLAIAQAARQQYQLDRVDLIVSRVALGKEAVSRPRLEDRVEVLRRAAADRTWLGVVVTDAQLLADIAQGYDVLILGADKWAQVRDPSYYGSVEERDAVCARLPRLAIAPRPPLDVPKDLPEDALLDVPPHLGAISSSAARSGEGQLMAPEAAAFDRETGAWSDPRRYEQWLETGARGSRADLCRPDPEYGGQLDKE
jgi:hypothetical protein